MKYDFDLDLSSKNSVSLIINKIKPGSTVLEFGPAAGRMTRYLNEQLNCIVYIVEIDEDAAKKASIYAEDKVVGNIEEFIWFDKFKHINFDYIIFADVLEHLYNPQLVLKKCVELLSENGSVITSVPNIAHNSVIIDLLQNKFEYRKTGLLDDTHIRFFTYSSLMNMIHSCNLVVIWEDAIIKSVGDTELDNYFDELPKAVTKFLKKRPLGDIYQYVLELKLQSAYPESLPKRSNIIANADYYYSQLYIDCGDGFSERQSIRVKANKDFAISEYDISSYNDIKKLRLDPLNTNCSIKIENIIFKNLNNEQYLITEFTSNADFIFKNIHVFKHDDPQIYFDSPGKEFNKVIILYKVIEYEYEDMEWIFNIISENNSELEGHLYNLTTVNADLIEKMKDSFEKTQGLLKEKQVLMDKFKKIENENLIIQEEYNIKDHQLNDINRQLVILNEELKSKNSELLKIHSSKIWKIYTRLVK